MKKHISFLIVLALNAILLSGQEDRRYLEGAVPEIDGKVHFTKNIKVHEDVTQSKLYNLLEEWARKEYKEETDSKRRVLLEKKDANYMVCLGEDKLVFKSSFLMLDQAIMSYQLLLTAEKGVCKIEVRNIKYTYADYDKPVAAEEMITDQVALNKEKTKLNRYYDKFRIFTIDLIDDIETKILAHLGQVSIDEIKREQAKEPIVASIVDVAQVEEKTTTTVVAPVVSPSVGKSPAAQAIPATGTTPVVEKSAVPMVKLTPAIPVKMGGYKNLDPEKMPGNILKMLKEDWTLITSGTGNSMNVMTASWGGLGRFWDKSVALTFLNPTRHSISTMDKGDTYTISFYTEVYRDVLNYCGSNSGKNVNKIQGSGLTPIITPSGAMAFSEAWMIIECKKVLAQQISENSVINHDLAKEWSKDGYHKIYIGEILNVWVK